MKSKCFGSLVLVTSLMTSIATHALVIERVDLASEGGASPSMAVDSSDSIHITYLSGANDGLKYATNETGSWVTEAVDSGVVAAYPSIALDSSDRVHVSYYDVENEDLKYASNASGSWTSVTLDNVGSAGSSAGNSVAIDTLDKVHISYEHHTDGVKYVSNTLGSWETESVDSGGEDPSIAVDRLDKAHISYRAHVDLMYATNASGAWVRDTLASVSYNANPSIALDSMDKVHIGYKETGLKYVTNASGSWVTETAQSSCGVFDSCGELPSFTMDSSDKGHVSSMTLMMDFTYFLDYTTNASGSWMTVGMVGRLFGGLNPGRLRTSIALDSSGIVYVGFCSFDPLEEDLTYKLMIASNRCVAEICGNLVDDDCDGSDLPCSSCSGSAAASTLGSSPVRGPYGLAKHLAYLLLPLGGVIGLIIWRRRR